ncbi:MAG: rRNA methyltransferase [Francisellaceae bacterium]|nr:rRNA methyltransferase [Francisellaceae bacterium]
MRSKSSARWLQRQHSDKYSIEAKALGYRSRAAFKLIEIQQKDKIISPHMTIIDLGAAPGGWSQMIKQWMGKSGRVIAIDILEMQALPNVEFIKGDFTQPEVLETLYNLMGDSQADLVISDLAPNLSGVPAVDQPRSYYLAELALDFAVNRLKPGGNFLVKVFQGEGFQEYLNLLKQHFKTVVVRKPKASRAESKELYLLAKNFLS